MLRRHWLRVADPSTDDVDGEIFGEFRLAGAAKVLEELRPRDNRSLAASEGRYRGSDLAVDGQVLPKVLPPPCSARVFSGFAALSNPAFAGYRRSSVGL